jgi:hypothetical protein
MTKKRLLCAVAISLCVVMSACGQQKNSRSTALQAGEVRLTRSNSEFVYKDHGLLIREYRLFGVTGNPFGTNNRDDFVSSFGAPLMTTHLLKVNHRNNASANFQQAGCEQDSAENGFNVVAIAATDRIAQDLDQLSRLQGERLCAKLTGRDLALTEWRLDGKPREPEIMKKMTSKQSGFDFGAPFLVQGVQPMACD